MSDTGLRWARTYFLFTICYEVSLFPVPGPSRFLSLDFLRFRLEKEGPTCSNLANYHGRVFCSGSPLSPSFVTRSMFCVPFPIIPLLRYFHSICPECLVSRV